MTRKTRDQVKRWLGAQQEELRRDLAQPDFWDTVPKEAILSGLAPGKIFELIAADARPALLAQPEIRRVAEGKMSWTSRHPFSFPTFVATLTTTAALVWSGVIAVPTDQLTQLTRLFS